MPSEEDATLTYAWGYFSRACIILGMEIWEDWNSHMSRKAPSQKKPVWSKEKV
jgi:hypothetical protein